MLCEKIATLDMDELKTKVNPHLLNIYPDAFEQKHPVYRCKHQCLLTGKRFDIMAKYLYAWHKDNSVAMDYALNIYKEHLKVWGGFKERDNSGKNSFEQYLNGFHAVLKSMKNNFTSATSLMPVGNTMTIIDGAHRSAAALLYEKEVDCVKINREENIYDYMFFRKRGLAKSIMDAMALQYCELNKNTFMVFLFPIARDKDTVVDTILNDYGKVLFDKEISLNENGAHRLMRQLYKAEHWLGNEGNGFAGATTHAKNKFSVHKPLKVILFESEDLLKVIEAKKIIRKQFAFGNDSIHITDTYEETLRLAQQMFNENSIEFFNKALNQNNIKFLKFFEKYQDALRIGCNEKKKFCIDSSSILAVYGIRDANDLDYLHYGDNGQPLFKEGINCHNDELIYYKKNLDELIFNPNNFFYYDGLKFLTLQCVSDMKRNRNEEKDKKDILLIEEFLKNGKVPDGTFTLSQPNKISIMKLKQILKKYMPNFLFQPMRIIWMLIKHGRDLFLTLLEFMRPQYRTISYFGFQVYYSRGTSLIKRIKHGQTYELELTKKIYLELSKVDTSSVLDIGSNIGLISLNILNSFPDIKIYAFEPGEHQAMLFENTIRLNKLKDRISLNKIALSNYTGMAEFSIHSSCDASGDGFFDTKRAGKTKSVQVKTIKLDEWWKNHKYPDTKLMKIDTEGAELWVLEGGKAFIGQCQPTIIFEMHPENLKPFPYEASDILVFFESIGYVVYTFGGHSIDQSNYMKYLDTVHDYVAKPKK